MVRFPVQPHSHEKIRVSMWRVRPDLPILDWKSGSPESPSWIDPSYRDRVRFRLDGIIELWDVGLGDQGTYEIETNYYGREPRNHDVVHFELLVIGSRSRWAIIPAVILLVLAVLGVWASYLCSNPHTLPDDERDVVGPGELQSGDLCTRGVTESLGDRERVCCCCCPVSVADVTRCVHGPRSHSLRQGPCGTWNSSHFVRAVGVWGEGRNGVLSENDQP
ncbi:uncharacterized protein LOC144603009 [Rhinoraja longicauda]